MYFPGRMITQCTIIGMQATIVRRRHVLSLKLLRASRRIENEEQRVRRRKNIETQGAAAYMKERNYMVRKHEEEKMRSGLVIGSLVYIDVARQLRRSRVPWHMKRIPAVIVNVVKDDVLYQVKAKSSLIKTLIRRDAMLVIHNDELRKEIDESSMKDAKGLDLENYCKSMWFTTDSRPICSCRGKCDTNTCPCRVRGYKCGPDCHSREYYAKNRTCSNYK